jgi:hypothetical protein
MFSLAESPAREPSSRTHVAAASAIVFNVVTACGDTSAGAPVRARSPALSSALAFVGRR